MIMYVIIGKQKCIQCDELKNLLDEKGIQYNYLDMTEMPHKTMTSLIMYCSQ
jgi:glutaredoxin